MKRQTKKILIWTVIAIASIMLVIILKNLDAFVNGFRAGGNIG